jgi:uncharacterized protein (DUF927 family)
MLQGLGASDHSYRQRGSIEEWRSNIVRYAICNIRVAVAISAAFAAALVGPCNLESGGLHLRGPSSIGKSTALLVAGSVWGGGIGGYVRSWRATANGLEGVALAHCDTLLCLDEMAQLGAREAGEAAYMLANGSGKSRSARDGSARRAAAWRILFLSSGEIGLADKVAEDGRGKRITAGQQVRIIDIPADPGAGMGLFEQLHDLPSAEALATHLRQAAIRYYGTPARRFLQSISRDLPAVKTAVLDHIQRFTHAYVPQGADGQVHRVAHRFALVGAAGEIAVSAGILDWPPGEATRAAAKVFADWLAARGNIEPAEIKAAIEQLRAFLFAHGASRFHPAWDAGHNSTVPIKDLAGFRKREGERWDYYITTSAWREEVFQGSDPRAIASHFVDRGLLLPPASGRHRAKSLQVPGYGKLRLYHVPAKVLEEDLDD